MAARAALWIQVRQATDHSAGRFVQVGVEPTPASAPVPSIEREELDRLRRENREFKQPNEILKLASAFRAGTARHH
jgi:hypothetical protein